MKLLVSGGTGFIGTPLCQALLQHGHELLVLSRSPHARAVQAGMRVLSFHEEAWSRELTGIEGVINLAGEPLTAKRWRRRQKSLIRDSRVQTTRRLVTAISALPKKPAVMISASGIGYYGSRGDEELDEADAPGRGFLADLCQAWEAEAQRAEPLGMRVVRLRLGLVLGPGGGALAKMTPPFRLFLGGPLGSGNQWVSWIHMDDVIGLIVRALTNAELRGAVNATAPHPVTMRTLCHDLGRVLHRPSWAPVPAAVLRLLLGEMAEMLVNGQRVLPRAALHGGYPFQFPELLEALEACLRPGRVSRSSTPDPVPMAGRR